ncbi:MAG: hypothetical protein NTZ55_05860 [Candidatus Roizmanbacteria bacterium]|nr:hypothetical protein [Candidatus Roizmanbacteria bacterium]
MAMSAVETGFKLSPGERMKVIENKPIPDRSRILDLYTKSERGIDVYLAHLFGTKKIDPQRKIDFLKTLDSAIDIQSKQHARGPETTTTVNAVLEQNKRANFLSFQTAADKEVQTKDLIAEDKQAIRLNFLRRYMIKGLEVATSLRDKNNYINSPFFEEARLKTTVLENPDSPEHEAMEILQEMNTYGIDTVQNYYFGAHEIAKAHNETQLKGTFEKWHGSLGNERIALYFQKLSQQKLKQLRSEGGRQIKKTTEQSASSYYEKFMETWNYVVEYGTPDSMKGPLAGIPKGVLKMLFNSREMMSGFTKQMADSDSLRKWFWQLRLGRNIKQFVETEATKTNKSTDFKRYQEKHVDQMLHSEAAGFDCQTFIESTPQRTLSPSSALAKTLESLMNYEQNAGLKLKETAHFTVFFGEDSYAKIALPTHFKSAEYLREQIQLALKNAQIQKVDLTARMRAELKYTGYSEKRDKNKDYRKYYGYEDGLTGDYIIQLKGAEKNGGDTLKPDEREPQSMFAVDSHKAAVLIDLRKGVMGKDGKDRDKIHIKYNHRAFDGLPAKKHFTYITNELETDTTKWESVRQIDGEHFFDNLIKYDGNVYPIQEGRAAFVDNGTYKKITIKGKGGKNIVISPTLARSLVLGLANNIDYFQVLYAQDPEKTDAEKKEYLDLNKEFFSDVQPAIVSFNHFKEAYEEWEKLKTVPTSNSAQTSSTVTEWTERLSQSVERAKAGDSDTAVFASVPGSNESLLYKVGLTFNEGAKLLRDSQGMVSPMPDTQTTLQRNIIFYTAQSDAYNPDVVDLEKPQKNLGVIGYSQEGKKGNAFYTVRKFPGQAQVEFHNAIKYQLMENDKNPRHTHFTLREMTKLVRMWDNLYRGKSSLGEYLKMREEVYENLKNWDVCGERNLLAHDIKDINGLQRYLNTILNASAVNTFSTKTDNKIEKTQHDFYEFFKAIGAKIG